MKLLKKLVLVSTLVVSSHTLFAQITPWWAETDSIDSVAVQNTIIADSIVGYAKSFVGIPYVWGGNTPDSGFDCSGFICYIYKKFDIPLPRTSAQQFDAGVPVPYVEAKPGDLILFAGPDNGPGNPGHVGIVLAYDTFNGYTFIHTSSPESGGVRISHEKSESYYYKRFLEIRRVIGIK